MSGYHELAKAELHLHLEGSVTPETMHELAPGASIEEIHERFRFNSFAGFLECFKWVVERLCSPEDYALVTRRLLETLAAQNVQYAEITLSAGVVLWKKQAFGPIFEAVRREAARSPVDVRWNLDAIRHFGAEHAMQVAELAAEYVNGGVVSFGIGGDEERGPAGWFTEVYGFARAKGLRSRLVLGRHVLRNALISTVALFGLNIGTLIGGAVITESVFAIPGVGRLMIDSIYGRDYPVIQGLTLALAILVSLVFLATDIVQASLDPRIAQR